MITTNQLNFRSVIRETFYKSKRGDRILVSESSLRRSLRLLIEMALSNQVLSFIDKIGLDFAMENWERNLWQDAAKTLDEETRGNGRQVLYVLGLLHQKRLTGEPPQDFIEHDTDQFANAIKHMQTIKQRSNNATNTIFDVKSAKHAQELYHKYVQAPGFQFRVPDPLTTISGSKIWDIYLPMNAGESCAIAQMGDPEIAWCTARTSNNMFYSYAKQPIWLYYIVERNNPANKYSIGVDGETKKIIPSRQGYVTVDFENEAFKFKDAFGSEDKKITGFIRKHASKIKESAHPGVEEILKASENLDTWKTFVKNQSTEVEHLYLLFETISDKDNARSSLDVKIYLFVSIVKALDKKNKSDYQNIQSALFFIYKKEEFIYKPILLNLEKLGHFSQSTLLAYSNGKNAASESLSSWKNFMKTQSKDSSHLSFLFFRIIKNSEINIAPGVENDLFLTAIKSLGEKDYKFIEHFENEFQNNNNLSKDYFVLSELEKLANSGSSVASSMLRRKSIVEISMKEANEYLEELINNQNFDAKILNKTLYELTHMGTFGKYRLSNNWYVFGKFPLEIIARLMIALAEKNDNNYSEKAFEYFEKYSKKGYVDGRLVVNPKIDLEMKKLASTGNFTANKFLEFALQKNQTAQLESKIKKAIIKEMIKRKVTKRLMKSNL